MSVAKVYEHAADLLLSKYSYTNIFMEDLACPAINLAASHVLGPARSEVLEEVFAQYFKPEGVDKDDIWFGPEESYEAREHRVMALLLMAEIVS